jgi:hypothetical protein
MYIGSLDAASNRAVWTRTIILVDSVTTELIDITGCLITMSVRNQDSKYQVLSATVGSGIAFTSNTAFTFSFSKDQMHALFAGTYDVGIIIADASNLGTEQLFAGSVPIVDGIVP